MLVDTRGNPISSAPSKKPRASLGGGNGLNGAAFPYDASNWASQEMGNWLPVIRSPDSEINVYRDRIVSRSRDIERNDGWASGSITRILDSMLGSNLRLSANPDYRTLSLKYGSKFDVVWANEFQRAAESYWRNYAESIDHHNDLNQQLTMGQMWRLAGRHKLIDGEAISCAFWMPERVGYGGSDYATTFLIIDPDRLSNPYQMMDSKYMRNGVEIDDNGVPVAYHIRSAEQNDMYNAAESMIWERVQRYDEDGWRRIVHDYDRSRAGQHRGVGVFVPVLQHMKMLAKYYGLELQAAAVQATFGTYVTSPYDPALIEDAMDDEGISELSAYQQLRADWSSERPAMLNGTRIPTLAPGEAINTVAPSHPHGNFTGFTREMQGMMAAAIGVSVEQISQDWTKTNYSSARAALLEAWKTLIRRRNEFSSNFATPMYSTWLGEAMERGHLPLPSGAPDFKEAATAYSRCLWMGPARGWVDPTKEPQGAIMKVSAGLSTMKQECIEQGLDWEEVVDQRYLEIQMFKDKGMDLPSWGQQMGALQAAEKPEKPSE